MDFRGFTACAIIALCLIKQSDAQPASWTITDGGGTAGTITGTAPDGTATVTIAEATAVAGTLFTVTAAPTTGTNPFAYTFVTADGNPSTIGDIATASSGAITLASGKSFDYETTASYVFKIIGTENSVAANTGTVTVTLNILDSVDITTTGFCLSASSYAAGSSIGTLTTDQSSATYGTLAGTDIAMFAVATTGEITVATGQTVAVATKTYYTFTIVGSTTTTGVADSLATGIHVVMQCSSSGAGQVVALISMLAVSVATHLFF